MTKSKAITTGTSLNILMWQQVQTTESWETTTPFIWEYYDAKSSLHGAVLRALTCYLTGAFPTEKYTYYNMHDEEILYLLIHHFYGVEILIHFYFVSI